MGWGPEVDTSRAYSYRAIGGKTYEVRFISTDIVATGDGNLLAFGETSVKRDAETLANALAASTELRERAYVLIGCSWGAAVLDYGKTRTRARETPSRDGSSGPSILGDIPTLAFAGPIQLPTRMQRWPIIDLTKDGDHGTLFVRRRLDDAVGQGGLRPLVSRFAGPTHNYTLAWHDRGGERVPGGFWGISGPGMLCPAAHDDDCPLEE